MEGVILYLLKKELTENILNREIIKVYKYDNFTPVFSMKNAPTLFMNFSESPIIYIKDEASYIDRLEDYPLWDGFLSGWRVKDITQNDWNRIYRFRLERKGEERYLYMEFTGRFSNMVLTDNENKIITALKPMGFSLDKAKRVIRGGFLYKYPSFKREYFPWELDLYALLLEEKTILVQDILMRKLKGIGKGLSEDILLYLGYKKEITTPLKKEDVEKIVSFLSETYRKWIEFDYIPYIIYEDAQPIKVTLFPLLGSEKSNSLSFALSFVYEYILGKRELVSKKKRLEKLIDEELEALEKKVGEIEEELKKAEKADEFLKKGELLKAHISKIKKGMDKIEVLDYYKYPPEKEVISLDPKLSPRENVEYYFKKYTKYKRGKVKLESIYKKLIKELKTLRSLKEEILRSDRLFKIEEKLKEMGVIKEETPSLVYKGEKIKLGRFVSPDGFLIFVGRSAQENELVLKIASPNDYWLHVRDIPGSHVIIKRDGKKDVPLSTIKYAASIAAFFSKGKNDKSVGVDYTLRKYVKPIKGKAPGFVTFREEKTIYVNPYDFKEALDSNHNRSS